MARNQGCFRNGNTESHIRLLIGKSYLKLFKISKPTESSLIVVANMTNVNLNVSNLPNFFPSTTNEVNFPQSSKRHRDGYKVQDNIYPPKKNHLSFLPLFSALASCSWCCSWNSTPPVSFFFLVVPLENHLPSNVWIGNHLNIFTCWNPKESCQALVFCSTA